MRLPRGTAGLQRGVNTYMSYSNGLGGRHVDLGILCALGSIGSEPVTARELALMVATSAGSVAPALRSLVKGGLVQRYWGELQSVRTSAITNAGREYLALRRDGAAVPS
jgi:predicted transcriptional regulator